MVTICNRCVLMVFITMTIMLTTSSAGKMTETQRLKRKIRKMTRQMVGFEHDLASNIVKIQNNTDMIQAYHPITTKTTTTTTTTTTPYSNSLDLT